MKKVLFVLLTLSSFVLGRNDIPSCYDALSINGPKEIQKELFVLVDQTTVLDKRLMLATYKNMMKYLKNGQAITIASFSSNANGKYTDVVYEGALEGLLDNDVQYDIAKKTLRQYKGCMNGQYRFAKKKVTSALVNVLQGASKKLPHSDILKSLDNIAKQVIQRSNAKHKTVLIVSDMMEHSSITSFYANGGLKNVDAEKEIGIVKKSGYIADFDNADVYILGAGMVNNDGYQNSKQLEKLRSFWEAYFSSAHANLKAFGMPMLLEEIE